MLIYVKYQGGAILSSVTHTVKSNIKFQFDILAWVLFIHIYLKKQNCLKQPKKFLTKDSSNAMQISALHFLHEKKFGCEKGGKTPFKKMIQGLIVCLCLVDY